MKTYSYNIMMISWLPILITADQAHVVSNNATKNIQIWLDIISQTIIQFCTSKYIFINSTLEMHKHLLNKITTFKNNLCNMFVYNKTNS